MLRVITSVGILLCLNLFAHIVDYHIMPSTLQGNRYMNVTILDSKEIGFDKKNGVSFSELSDIAYKDDTLYALSDKGILYRLKINLQNDKINKLALLNAIVLKNKKGKKLKKSFSDAEGLCFKGDNLLLSFEKKHRVALYNIKTKKLKKIKIHKDLKDKKQYVKENKGLEAVAYNKKYGAITAPELPLKNRCQNFHTLYTQKEKYKFKAHGVIKAIDFIDKNTLLVLLRSSNKSTKEMTTSLVRVELDNCKNSKCQSEVLANLNEHDGWKIDNFEGLTKVSHNKFLIISDNQGNMSQKTLLVFFEIIN